VHEYTSELTVASNAESFAVANTGKL